MTMMKKLLIKDRWDLDIWGNGMHPATSEIRCDSCSFPTFPAVGELHTEERTGCHMSAIPKCQCQRERGTGGESGPP